jgi:hypothetical protein
LDYIVNKISERIAVKRLFFHRSVRSHMGPRPAWQEARKVIQWQIDPIVRLEAIPLELSEGRVLAEDLLQTSCLPHLAKGLTIGSDQVRAMRCIGAEEVLVYSQPKALMVEGPEGEDGSPDLSQLARYVARFGAVPLLERCGTWSQRGMVHDNIGADLVLVRGPDPGTRSYCREKGRPLFEGIALSPGGGTSLYLIDDTPVMLLPYRGQELLGAELLPLQALVRQMTRKDDSVPVRGTTSLPISSRPDRDEVKFLRAGTDGTMTLFDASAGPSGAYQYYLVIPAGSPTLSPGDQVVCWPC